MSNNINNINNQIENMSLFIPNIFTNITKEKIIQIIENEYELGKIKQIDLISKYDQNHYYNMAYIHFEYWNDNEANKEFQKKIKGQSNSNSNTNTNSAKIKIYYEKEYNQFSEYYWIVLENKAKKIIPGERKQRLNLNQNNEPTLQQPHDNQSQNTNLSTPKRELTNKDFAKLVNAPIKMIEQEKKQEKEQEQDDNFDFINSCSKKLNFDEVKNDDKCNDSNIELVSTDYVEQLESQIEYLLNLVDFLKKDNMYLMNQNRALIRENQNYQYRNRSCF